MPIDPSKALGADLGESEYHWDADDVILYHLGLGAGVPATDPGELEYTYEKNLKVLPSFATIPALQALDAIVDVEGLEFDSNLLLHGEQDVILHRPIPQTLTARSSARISELWDKGKSALCVVEVDTRDDAGGEPVFTNRISLFLRGAGGFGGDPGPKASGGPPDRAPDGVIERTLMPQQALLYRLSGDNNPVHADPKIAAMAGFDRPIIHGLCSYGLALKAIVDELLGGDVTRVARWSTRFAGVGYPGDTYAISHWAEGDRIHVQVTARNREDAPVLSNAVVEARA
jgi:acyl dehydratase